MNTTEQLLADILAELRKQNGEAPVQEAPQQKSKRWMPEINELYYHVDDLANWYYDEWYDDEKDHHLYTMGNCYQPHEKERAIWEQVTRRKYEQALWDAADWDGEKDAYIGCWNTLLDKPGWVHIDGDINTGLPRFATEESYIDAHIRILGDDAKRYFTGEV